MTSRVFLPYLVFPPILNSTMSKTSPLQGIRCSEEIMNHSKHASVHQRAGTNSYASWRVSCFTASYNQQSFFTRIWFTNSSSTQPGTRYSHCTTLECQKKGDNSKYTDVHRMKADDFHCAMGEWRQERNASLHSQAGRAKSASVTITRTATAIKQCIRAMAQRLSALAPMVIPFAKTLV